MASKTLMNEGIRQNFAGLGMRNFENDGSVQYSAVRNNLWWVSGSYITKGTTLPYDVAGTSYSKAAISLMRKYWDQGWIAPLT